MSDTKGHPYRLRRIELKDFKSVAQADVELRPLTVVVGANSSGKSTLLQSILAVTQAVRSRTSSAEFPLNGKFVRLGTFNETRNFLAEQPDGQMEVGFRIAERLTYHERFELDMVRELDTVSRREMAREREMARRREAARRRGMLREREMPLSEVIEFGWRAYLADSAAESGVRGGFAQIKSLCIEVEKIDPESGERTTALSCDVSDLATDAEVVDAIESLGRRDRLLMRRGPEIAAVGHAYNKESGQTRQVDAVVLAGGVPQTLLRSVKQLDRLAQIWWDTAEALLEEQISHERLAVAEAQVSGEEAGPDQTAVEQALADIDELVSKTIGDPFEWSRPLTRRREIFGHALERRWYRNIGELTGEQRSSIAKSMVQLGQDRFRKDLHHKFENEEWVDEEILVEHSGYAGEYLGRFGHLTRRFFSNEVRYLGPLREAPNVLYDPGPSKLDLGVSGEYSAAVLHAQARTTVVMPTDKEGEPRRLTDALDYWLREFELADNARSEDRGRMGIGLSVTPPGLGREVDLTAVGVGVSQVLPVLLLCMLAEPGMLVVLEQPELHLHPRLEQKLADFLLACARSGRQLVIETHSEHLVNRLRHRIAGDPTDATHDLVKLVFAESQDGVTSYREPEINQYGGIGEDWPDGFLDLGAREAQDLIRESLIKRKRDEALGSG